MGKTARETYSNYNQMRAYVECLILHQFNLYVLLICGKEIGDDISFLTFLGDQNV